MASYRSSIIAYKQYIALEDSSGYIDPIPVLTSGGPIVSEFDKLNSIIEAFNRRFGDIDWGEGVDKQEAEEILTQQIPAKIGLNKEGLLSIINSDKSNAREESNNLVKSLMQGMMFTNTAIYKKFVDDDNFRRRYEEFIFDMLWSTQQVGRGGLR